MIGLDTNVLARYYIHDESDAEAQAQHQTAHALIESGQPLKVGKTVLLEFEWVMRGYYRFTAAEIADVMQHLLTLQHIEIEDRVAVELALSHTAAGLEFADAMHLAAYRDCASMASFDDKKFARRAKRIGLSPRVFVPE